jgi:hypothetical protein
MTDNIDEMLQEARNEGFNDANSYRICIDRVRDGLRLIREEKIPQSVTDTGVDFFELSIKKLYQKARVISEKYFDSDGKRTVELNKLDTLVREACNGVKR